VVIAIFKALGSSVADFDVAEALAYSLLWGGLPYSVLALWATWWIGGRPEPAIQRLMWRAPLLMAGVFVPLALGVGVSVGAVVPFIGVAMLGLVFILVLGYCYVGLTILLRQLLGPAPAGSVQ
jgi:hypothetical protein